MTVWVVQATAHDYSWSTTDSVWSSRLAAEQRADYVRDNSDMYGDWWHADVREMTVDACTQWPRETRDG